MVIEWLSTKVQKCLRWYALRHNRQMLLAAWREVIEKRINTSSFFIRRGYLNNIEMDEIRDVLWRLEAWAMKENETLALIVIRRYMRIVGTGKMSLGGVVMMVDTREATKQIKMPPEDIRCGERRSF